jgi:uncharacterized damage-inducible protein DinB
MPRRPSPGGMIRAMTRRIWSLATVVVVTISAPTGAQAPASSISQALKENWDSAKMNFRGSADVMPEAKYGFKPVDTVRSFGAILGHVAGANYEFCAAAKGEKSPHAEDEFEKSATTKAALVKALDESIAYCDAIYQSDDNKLLETVPGPFGGGRSSRANILMGNTGHVNEHYGNLVTYLRINGLVPPSSAPRRQG